MSFSICSYSQSINSDSINLIISKIEEVSKSGKKSLKKVFSFPGDESFKNSEVVIDKKSKALLRAIKEVKMYEEVIADGKATRDYFTVKYTFYFSEGKLIKVNLNNGRNSSDFYLIDNQIISYSDDGTRIANSDDFLPRFSKDAQWFLNNYKSLL